jgi:transcriptional regulator with XRE-family HTH domain
MKFSLTVRGRRLLRDLKTLRENLGLSPDEVGKRLGWHRAKIYRIEKGESRLILDDLYELLDVYGVRSPRRESMIQLGRDAWKRGWWLAYSDLYKGGSYFVVEDAASSITFQALHLLPGLLQTPEYAHALIQAAHPEESPSDVRRRVEVRLARQQLLRREAPPEITAIIDEAVLLRHIGGADVTKQQLNHLIDLVEHSNINICVVPFSAGAHGGMDGQFTILEFPDEEDLPVAFQEGLFGDVFVESDNDLARYTLAADLALRAALPPDESVAVIVRIAREMTT